MKKWMIPVVFLFLAGSLTACGSTTGTDVEEVYTQAMEAAQKIESAEILMDMKQQMGSPDAAESMEIESNMEAEVTMDPLAMHQKGTMNIMMDGVPDEMKTEMYMVDEEIYVYDSSTQSWMKVNNSMPIELINRQQRNPSEQLKLFEQFVDDLEAEETENSYTLKMNGDGEEVKELMDTIMDESMTPKLMAELGEEASEVVDNVKVHKLHYEMFFDKETYETSKFNMDIEMTVNGEGQQLEMIQKVSAEYKNINTIDSIQLPQEVKDGAVGQF
ncbi:DUF6612 family protein [Virgibacillus ainsalahensis]